MKKIALPPFSALAFAAALAAAPLPAAACGSEAYLGQTCIMATSFCPAGTVALSGQTMDIRTNSALYALMGCTFGGDCRTTFKLPDLRGRVPVQYGQGPGLTAHPIGQAFGQESVTQTVAMLAPHTHTVTVTGGTGAAPGTAAPITLGTTGNAAPIPTVPPEMALTYCIVVQNGIFPARP